MTVIEAENISKMYRLGTVGTGSLAHDVNRWWYKIRGKEDPYQKIAEANARDLKGDSDYVWSLKDISFTVNQGDVVGIIGRNGAGKSTLLKILSRITSPTEGKIKIRGRVASLLEVGTGFHPELTGRENIFLNGAILGMSKAEIKSKFDEIVAFSGIERYIDTPVKRYSSGMYVRLAFAVAAHLEPEILIVDEVLAVGDAEFQKKCLGKMKDVSSEGRTVLFVSHNMAAVKSLCNKGIVIKNGVIDFVGNIDNAVNFYLNDGKETLHTKIFNEEYDKDIFTLNRISVYNEGKADTLIVENEDLKIKTEITLKQDPEKFHITFHLYSEEGDALFSFSSQQQPLIQGKNTLTCTIPSYFLQPGKYFLHFFFVKDKRQAVFYENDILSFRIINAEREIGVYMGKEPGYVRPNFNWLNNTFK
jgi:lipopolysaccharide transport system ATP-binding protein